ncbi:hypothetical protein BI364_15010 [Acidihalobacter yilgarnensis]|uniref:Uncharacterized protein n=1 Tax=Acidihalobacter yilgarnensis TaxID=2819280 RepID=A0A1D8IRI7_9GAMM|nr:hypothetical protein [Acidihalobacter yilgarnensis]AOU99076.1 hypothetical protein BI364_15010 [Acidihalobacter yilgarnensis]
MPSILVKNTKNKNLEWRNITFPENSEIPVDVILFDKLINEFVPVYGKCGLTWDENKFRDELKKIHPPEKLRLLKNVGQWLKANVLAALIVAVITIILGYYMPKWL